MPENISLTLTLSPAKIKRYFLALCSGIVVVAGVLGGYMKGEIEKASAQVVDSLRTINEQQLTLYAEWIDQRHSARFEELAARQTAEMERFYRHSLENHQAVNSMLEKITWQLAAVHEKILLPEAPMPSLEPIRMEMAMVKTALLNMKKAVENHQTKVVEIPVPAPPDPDPKNTGKKKKKKWKFSSDQHRITP